MGTSDGSPRANIFAAGSILWRRSPENDSVGTNALETKVSGMITMNEALLMTSTLGTSRPT